MKLKVFVLFIFCLIGSTFSSCFTESCSPQPPYFEITGINSANIGLKDNSGYDSWDYIGGKAVNWSEFAIRIVFDANYISSKASFGGAAFALSCPQPGDQGSKMGVETITVKTINHYNENYPAESVINDIVLANRAKSLSARYDDFFPLDSYLAENSESIKRQHFAIKFSEPPAESGPFSFEITYRLKNGEEFQNTTETGRILK